jgi:hypothetical protein
MKNLIYFILILITFTTFSCKRASDPFGFYRPTHDQNFITTRGAELYAYTANDSVLIRADYFIKILGQIKTYGNKIYDYGHCWHPTNANPTIGVDSLRTNSITTDHIDNVSSVSPSADSISFISAASKLHTFTKYYIRSYVITADAQGNPVDTGYNPVVTEVTTKNAIDEWFNYDTEIQKQRPQGAVYGALGFNFGDSIFFGTGKFGGTSLSNAMDMYDPVTDAWSEFSPLPIVQYYPLHYGSTFMNGVGFGIEFKKINAPINSAKSRCIFVGLGDYMGDDALTSKSQTFIQYDFSVQNPHWEILNQSDNDYFSGGARSSAVCFVIGDKAYIGTGYSGSGVYLEDWYVLIPANLKNQNPGHNPWLQMTNIPGGINSVHRRGAVAFSMNGRGYFGLGYNEDGQFMKDFWEFRPSPTPLDPTNGSWKSLTPFPGSPRQNAVAFVLNDQAYVGTGDNIVGDMEGSYSGNIFQDLYRYDPFNNSWTKIRDYTNNSVTRPNISKKITKAVAFSSKKDNFGYVGFGIIPDSLTNRFQSDLWIYRPYDKGNK